MKWGGAHAVNEIAEDKRKQLAEKLKMDALAEIQMRQGEREHGYAKELQGEKIKAETELQGEKIKAESDLTDKKISSDEKIASDRNAMLERIAGMENSMKDRMLKMDAKTNAAQMMRAQVAAFTEARKVLEGGGTTEEANAVLEAAGLPAMEEYIADPGSSGFFGIGGREPKIGRRVAGSGGILSGGGSGLSAELDALLQEGLGTTRKEQVSAGKDGGIVGDAMASTGQGNQTEEINPMLPSSPDQWNVKEKNVNGKVVPVAIVDGQEIELTEYEYVYWMTNKGKQRTATTSDVLRDLSSKKMREHTGSQNFRKGTPTY